MDCESWLLCSGEDEYIQLLGGCTHHCHSPETAFLPRKVIPNFNVFKHDAMMVFNELSVGVVYILKILFYII